MTVIDSHTTRVCATLNCNYMPADDLAEVLYELVVKYMPNAIINIERNGVELFIILIAPYMIELFNIRLKQRIIKYYLLYFLLIFNKKEGKKYYDERSKRI